MTEFYSWLGISAFCVGFLAGMTLTIAGFIGSGFFQREAGSAQPGDAPQKEKP
jgi:hypothetical protein